MVGNGQNNTYNLAFKIPEFLATTMGLLRKSYEFRCKIHEHFKPTTKKSKISIKLISAGDRILGFKVGKIEGLSQHKASIQKNLVLHQSFISPVVKSIIFIHLISTDLVWTVETNNKSILGCIC